jgi:polyisoprenoid-binding protein YceI
MLIHIFDVPEADMNLKTLLRKLTLLGVVLLLPVPGIAEDSELCAPFRDGKVDETLLSSMLSAAKQGHLYRIDDDSSSVGFCVDSQLARIEGKFNEFQGGMALNPVAKTDGQTMVVIKTASVETKSAFIKNMVKGENFFDVEHNPEILFVSKRLDWTSEGTAELKGDLTMRGKTKPVTFHVSLKPIKGANLRQAEKVQVKATANVSRSEFGMTSLTSLISDEVQLCMTAEATKYEEIKPGDGNGKH